MKRKLAAAFATLVLTGCGAAAHTETPQQVVSAASEAMTQLHSAKFNMTATILEQFPAAFVQQLGPPGAALANLSVDMSGNGQAKFPDRASMSMQVKTGSVTVSTDLVFAGGKIYVKDPQTGTFTQPQGADALSQFTNQADPLSSAAILKTAQSVKDLGDTTLNGTAVHHYQIVPDKNKVADQASTQQAKDLVRSMLQNGSLQLEVWIGKDDHLLHRLKDDTDATIDLNQVMQASGQQLPPGFTLPSGATVHTVVHATIDYHDFNTPVTVSVPAVSPS
jgi:PBP1b-binding outer membrane lipoprotein LpoB